MVEKNEKYVRHTCFSLTLPFLTFMHCISVMICGLQYAHRKNVDEMFALQAHGVLYNLDNGQV